MHKKKKMTAEQEFEIMKLVLDKFLWLGVAIMGFGLYFSFTVAVAQGIYYLMTGAIVFILLLIIIVKEYEFIS